ncbi:hypothetical protein QYM36_016288, partial [Artemia franciscana]
MQEIRNLPISIAEKLEMKNKLLHMPTFRVRGVAALRLKQRKFYHSLLISLKNGMASLVPWNEQLKSIEGKYGSAHVAFFMFIRWLFFLNLAMSMIVGLFIILPSELSHLSEHCSKTFNESGASQTRSSGLIVGSLVESGVLALEYRENMDNKCFENEGTAVCGMNDWTNTSLGSTKNCWKSYVDSVNVFDDVSSSVQDFIQGTGWMEVTLSFYGYYKPVIFHWSSSVYYNLPVCYVLVMVSLALLCFFTICNTIRRGLKLKAYSDNREFPYLRLIFSSWNYFIADFQTRKLKHRIMTQELKAALFKDKIRQEKLSRTTKQNVGLFFIRLFCWLMVIALLGASSYAIYSVVVYSQEQVKDTSVEFSLENIEIFVISFLPSIVITFLNLFLPLVFCKIITWERYQNELEISIEIFRRIVVRVQEREFFSSKGNIIVIHPGSKYLRIGRVSDLKPYAMLQAVARLRSPDAQRHEDTLLVPDVRVTKHLLSEVEDCCIEICSLLQSCIQSNGGHRGLTPYTKIASMNRSSQQQPESIDKSNLSYVRTVDPNQAVVGDKVVYLEPRDAYNIHFPFRRGELNVHPGVGGSLTSVINDVEIIWCYAIEKLLRIPKAELGVYKAVLVIPDIYNRQHLKELTNLLLVRLGFASCFLVQDHVCATAGSGVPTACVIDIGDQKTSVSCVDECVSIKQSR